VRPHVSVITLGVRDLRRARAFYAEALGWPIQQEDDNWVCFTLEGGSTAFALYPWGALADDANVPPEGDGFRGVTLSYITRTEQRVEEVLAEAEAAGATVPRAGAETFWGGYSGVFVDPEGHAWEVAHNPNWTIEDDGAVRLSPS
jgi:predicted enzyme related to lactoylglutathione lyase